MECPSGLEVVLLFPTNVTYKKIKPSDSEVYCFTLRIMSVQSPKYL